MKKYLFKTIGCKTNQYETQLLREQFSENGFKEAQNDEIPEVCLINTCTVTEKSDKKSKKIIKNIIKRNPKSKIIVTGCGVNNPYSGIKDIKGVDLFISNEDKDKTISFIKKNCTSSVDTINDFFNRDRAFVKIQDGCDNFCSYCIVPYTRGAPRSRDANKVEQEVKELIRAGYKEIVLTGIRLGFFGKDTGDSLIDLINRLVSLKDLDRLRLSSIEPNEIGKPLIERIKDSDKICRHLHIPIQSGDDGILKLMNRGYKIKSIRILIETLIKEIPDIGISADFMVGFPAESDDNFKNTLKLVHDYDFVKTHIFSYSDRRGTAAYNFDKKVARETKKERASLLKQASLKSAGRFKKRFINRILDVLIERQTDKRTHLLCGYTDNYIRTHITNGKESFKNNIIPTKITSLKGAISYSEAI